MANLDLLMKALDTAVWECGEAFKGLPDDEVWKRPHPRLLSIGELAVHIGYWEAVTFFGRDYESPFMVQEHNYYNSNVQQLIELPLSAEAVYGEVRRIHEAAKASYVANPHDSEEPNPSRGNWTWGFAVEYQVFHVSYHTGQMYSVRHLLDHVPVDN